MRFRKTFRRAFTKRAAFLLMLLVVAFPALTPSAVIAADYTVETIVHGAGQWTGTVSLDPPGGTYVAGTLVTATAVPGPGSTFNGWLETFSTQNPYAFVVTGPTRLTAYFDRAVYEIDVGQTGFGFVDITPSAAYHGDTLTLKAWPMDGYRFSHWSGDVVDTAATLRMPVTGPVHLVANFEVLPAYAPVDFSAADIPADQGGRVKLTWKAAMFDRYSAQYSFHVTEYQVWRSRPASGPAGFDLHATVPAGALEAYSLIVATRGDSTAADSARESFFVRAWSLWAGVWWDSPVRDAASSDNLAPPSPASGQVVPSGAAYTLRWSPVAVADFAAYRVRQAPTPAFEPANTVIAATVREPEVLLPLVSAQIPFSRITAMDSHGNESAPLLLTPPVLDAVPPGARFALHGALENPCRGPVIVSFELPASEACVLILTDIGGRTVASAHERAPGIGLQRAALSPAGGLAPGLYFVRLVQGARSATRRVVVLGGAR